MAMAVYCTQVGKRQLQVLFLILTIVLGFDFSGHQGGRILRQVRKQTYSR